MGGIKRFAASGASDARHEMGAPSQMRWAMSSHPADRVLQYRRLHMFTIKSRPPRFRRRDQLNEKDAV